MYAVYYVLTAYAAVLPCDRHSVSSLQKKGLVNVEHDLLAAFPHRVSAVYAQVVFVHLSSLFDVDIALRC